MFVSIAYLLDILGRHSVSVANLLCWITRQRLICFAGAGLERDSHRYNPASSEVHAEETVGRFLGPTDTQDVDTFLG